MATRTRKRAMSADHKAALAAGRESSKAVRQYLEVLEANKPKRGRKRTPESVQKRLAVIEDEIAEASPLQRLLLVQEQADLEAELATMDEKVDIGAYEKAFIKHAHTYAESKGLSYSAFRAVGVSAEVLKKAGITRGM